MSDLENKRNEQLIKEREEYEKAYFSQVIDEMIESDALDKLISDRLEYFDEHFDFDPSPEYQRLEEMYFEPSPADQRLDEIYYEEYESKFNETDPFDSLDGVDYPDGPFENLNGRNFDEYCHSNEIDLEDDLIEYDSLDINESQFDVPEEVDAYEEMLSNQIKNYTPDDYYDEVLDDILKDEQDEYEYIKSLIESHEKEFFDHMLKDAIQEQFYFEKAIDDLIKEHLEEEEIIEFEMEYEPYWYDEPFEDAIGGYWPDKDESVIDPFDSFGEIDYPEGEPQYQYHEPIDYEGELQKDFEKYQGRKEHYFGYSDDELQEPDDELILEPPEDNTDFEDIEESRNESLIKEQEKVESLYKDYFTKDDTLDKMIKEKLKEKKFNL